jgi:hypothetical protein
MPYYINDALLTLDDLQRRIKAADLIPSRMPLLDDIEERFFRLEAAGIKTMADFRKAVRSSKGFEELAGKTGIERDYLLLLRREVEGYFPKAFPIQELNWLDGAKLNKLIDYGFKNSVLLYEALESPEKRKELYASGEIDNSFIYDVFCILDLTRIQWVSPLTARILYISGCRYARDVAAADPNLLYNELVRLNEEKHYFKGSIGLRDVKRLVQSAAYLI